MRDIARLLLSRLASTVVASTIIRAVQEGQSLASTIKFELLDQSVREVVSGESSEIAGEKERWILTALLLDGFVSKRRIKETTGNSDATVRKLIERTSTRTRLSFENDRGRGWALDRTAISIDARELVELVEGSEYAPAEERASALARARSLWKSGLPDFPNMGVPSPDFYARVNLAHKAAVASGRRILVVDDQIAEAIANALGTKHMCEVARSFEEYRTFEHRLGTFDLVVVDRRLRTDMVDNSGDLIAERINSRADSVPVFMMTYRLPAQIHLDDWEMNLGLAGVVLKENDDPQAEVDKIAQRIDEVFRDGPVDRACSAIEMGMVRYRRQATKQLTEGGTAAGSAALLEMNREADTVIKRAQGNDLAGARLRRRAFLNRYGLD
jgi:hypothetical protein